MEYRGQNGDDGTDEEDRATADRAIMSVKRKLAADLSVKTTVNDLIMQARDDGNLYAIYHGWQACESICRISSFGRLHA